MRDAAKAVLRRALSRAGYEIRPVRRVERFEPEFESLYEQTAPFTLTSKERMYCCWQAARYVVRANLPGDVVECGVWRGGATMLLASTLRDAGDDSRTIWLYDTFQGMSEPTEHDVKTVTGGLAREQWERARRADGMVDWWRAPLDEVRANVARVGYPSDRLRFVAGKVEDTIPNEVPERIAVLRLDTDWYESTKHELEHLFPRLVHGGVLMIDDYGSWMGARKATDEFLRDRAPALMLHRIDFTGRAAIKVELPSASHE